jgi:hypothetical protein
MPISQDELERFATLLAGLGFEVHIGLAGTYPIDASTTRSTLSLVSDPDERFRARQQRFRLELEQQRRTCTASSPRAF